MNFFEHQDQARSSSGKLIVLFILGVLATIAVIYLTLAFGVGVYTRGDNPDPAAGLGTWWWQPEILGLVSFFVLLTVGYGSWSKLRALDSGGPSVAFEYGGRLIDPNTSDPDERRLRNIVEEMAIASGVPVPEVFVMDNEAGINAFAAGYNSNDAAVAVTRGCLDIMNREELQGIIAHEFSHILNGDMRLNVRMLAVLHGLLLIGLTGKAMLFLGWSRNHGSNWLTSRRSRDQGNHPLIMGIGLVLFVTGYVGVFFGRFIKSAISRQREYLADASAVQFTRNPSGIASALRKIGGFRHGANVRASGAEEISHFFFANMLISRFDWLATHPPLAERIKRIDPSFVGTFPRVEPRTPAERVDVSVMHAVQQHSVPGATAQSSPLHGQSTIQVDATQVVDLVGSVSPEHLLYSSAILEALPTRLRSAARQTMPAVAIVYALILDRDAAIREQQFQLLSQHTHPKILALVQKAFPVVSGLGAEFRLPLLELCVPALRGFSPDQYEQFEKELQLLVEADQQISLFEFVLLRSIRNWLRARFRGTPHKSVQFPSINAVIGDIRNLISATVHAGTTDPSEAAAAFERAVAVAPPASRDKFRLLNREAVNLKFLDASLDRLSLSSPTIKKKVVEMLAHAALADGKITVNEAEMLRTIADTLQAPLPPFLNHQS